MGIPFDSSLRMARQASVSISESLQYSSTLANTPIHGATCSNLGGGCWKQFKLETVQTPIRNKVRLRLDDTNL